MPRKARIDAPGALHHIIIRGIERKAIFKDSADRKNFTERLERIIPETQTRCYGWALMTNHVHLLFKTGMAPLATVMRRLLTPATRSHSIPLSAGPPASWAAVSESLQVVFV